MALAAIPIPLQPPHGLRDWGPIVLGAFFAGWGAAWMLLKGFGASTRRDALSRFKVRDMQRSESVGRPR